MTNSSEEPTPEAILDRLSALLGEDRLRREIDEPIDRIVAKQLDARRVRADNPRQLHSFFGAFVKRLYLEGPCFTRHLSDTQAKAEAVRLLDQAYRGAHSRGYAAAVVDFMDKEWSGPAIVLGRLAEGVKALERQKRLRWAIATVFDRQSGVMKRRLAEVLVERAKPFLPDRIVNMPLGEIAPHLPMLAAYWSGAASTLRKQLEG